MWVKLFVIGAAAVLCSGECVTVEPKGFGTVEVSAFSTIGERIPDAVIDLIEVGTRKSLKGSVHGAIAAKVPYGTYTLSVSAPGFHVATRVLRVGQTKMSVRTQVAVAAECGGEFASLTGSIRNTRGNDRLWVKVVPIVGHGGEEERVSRDGSFAFSGLDGGDYFFFVVDGKAILHTEVLQILGAKRVSVELE
jgi:hypothetical protein